jgi:DNA-binding transcriptional ArsR family regulator
MQQTITDKEQRLIHAMQLLGDTTRYKIFKLMLSDREMCVSEIADSLNISPSAVSQHFRNFEMLGLVDKHRYGQKICYALKKDDVLVNDLKIISKEK